MDTKQLIGKFIKSGLMVDREIIEEIVKREDDEIYKGLFEIVQKDDYWKRDGPGDSWCPYHVFFILGLKGDEKSFEILKYMISQRTEELDDWITEHLSAILYSFGLGYYDNIKSIALDKSSDMYVRIAAIETLCAKAILNPDVKERTVELCKQFLREEEDKLLISLALPDIAEIRNKELFELVKESHERCDTGPFRICDMDDLKDLYEGTGTHKEYIRCTSNLWDHFSDKNLNYYFERYYGGRKTEKYPDVVSDEKNKKREKTGRNDPCPCGSGKKYKKCCGNPAKLK
ncbi:MAG: hypothetical protein CVT88_01740 [Candidatus Altiarchaeales archaeon HGW-Altiarchaeales-1]|nr:MAG: hypothetical protein CVT88_01740 [Candidatus Altiarchaeales archaeon HGW-Altiarchaeales-1]